MNNKIKKGIDPLHKISTIFLSYSWNDTDVANSIDEYLSKNANVSVKRDIRDIGVWKSIREFMESIREQDYAVLVISDAYLKSSNCMFEVMEIMKEKKYEDRIFPAVVNKTIYDPFVRVGYIEYWQKKCEELERVIKTIDIVNTAEIIYELKRYRSIASSIGEFLSLVADMNNPQIEDVKIQVVDVLLNRK